VEVVADHLEAAEVAEAEPLGHRLVAEKGAARAWRE
jgi:hypothetical protein